MTPEGWKAVAIAAGRREAETEIYAKNLENIALILFVCNMVLLFMVLV